MLEDALYNIVCRVLRFIMYELIHPDGVYHDPNGVLSKNWDVAFWSAKGHDTQKKIEENFERERKKDDEKDRSWPSDKKD